MSDYAKQWADAKTAYEKSTGGKKPSEAVSKFKISIRKKSGVGKFLAAVDKAMPSAMNIALSDKDFDNLTKPALQARKASLKYFGMLSDLIEKEKLEKESSKIYRDLKILRATLEDIHAGIERDVDKLRAFRIAETREFSRNGKAIWAALKNAKASLNKECKNAIRTSQILLKEPDPTLFNDKIQDISRQVTQPLTVILKFTEPSAVSKHAANKAALQRADPQVAALADDLIKKTKNINVAAKPLVAYSGTNPSDASLGLLAKGSTKLPTDASPEDVKTAVKNLLTQVKTCMEFSKNIPA